MNVANPNLLAQLQARLRMQAPPPTTSQLPGGGGGGSTDKSIQDALRQYVNAEPWDYFDTLYLNAGGTNFAGVTNPIPFFSTRTIGSTSVAVTSMTDQGKMDADFKCYAISVDVSGNSDIPQVAASGVATLSAFVETIVNCCVLQIMFGSNIKLLMPVIKCPTGGGVYQGVKVRTQAAAANSDSAFANNGQPTATARRMLDEPIFFKNGEAFTLNLNMNATALAKIQALQALAGNDQAVIRVNLEGIRGKPFLQGTA